MLIRASLKAAPSRVVPETFVVGFASEAMIAHPENVDVHIAIVDLYLASGMMVHALGMLEGAYRLAPDDPRVNDRKTRLARVRRTQEFASRSSDPETLDALTTPLDPETDVPTQPVTKSVLPLPLRVPSAPPPRIGGLDMPRRQPTVHGLAPAPRLASTPGPAPAQGKPASTPAPPARIIAPPIAEDSTDTRTEDALPPHMDLALAPSSKRKRTIVAGFGAAHGESTGTGTSRPIIAPPLRADDVDDPKTKVGDDGPATAMTRTTVGRNPIEDDPKTSMGSSDEGPRTAVAGASADADLDDGWATTIGPSPNDGVRRPMVGNAVVQPAPNDDEGPATTTAVAPRPRPHEPVDDPSTGISRIGLPLDPAEGLAPLGNRIAARRAARRPLRSPEAPPVAPAPSPTTRLEDPQSEQDVPTKVTALPPLGFGPSGFPPAPSSDPGDDEHDVPTQARELPRSNLPPPSLMSPPGARPRSPTLEGTGVGRIPPPPPSDPDTETATAVRPLSVMPPRGLSQPPPQGLGMPRLPRTTLASQQLVSPPRGRQSTPPPPRATPAAFSLPRPAFADDMSTSSRVTSLHESSQLRAEPQVAPVVKGGTMAMNVTSSSIPVAPPELPLDDDDEPAVRTHILNATEALAAARADPRPTTARSRTQAPPPAEPTGFARGQVVGAGAMGGQAPSFGPPPSFGAPPAALGYAAGPSFGPPPAFSPPPEFGLPPASQAPPPTAQAGGSWSTPAELSPSDRRSELSPSDLRSELSPSDLRSELSPSDLRSELSPSDLRSEFEPLSLGAPAYDPPAPPRGLGPSAPPGFPGVPVGDAAYNGGGQEAARPLKVYIALGVVFVIVATIAAYAVYLVATSGRAETTAVTERPLPPELKAALLSGSPKDLREADAMLKKLEGAGAQEILLARVRREALVSTETASSKEALVGAIEAARKGGVPEEHLASGVIALALAAEDPKAADLARAVKKDGAVDPWSLWIAGVALERVGAPEARTYYEAAVAAAPTFRRAEIQLDRWLILEGQTKAANERIGKLPAGDPQRAALEALSWARARASGGDTSAPAPKLVVTSADLPKALHPVFVAVTIMAQPRVPIGRSQKPVEPSPESMHVIEESDSPGLAVTFGYFGLWRGDGALVQAAMKRAVARAPKYAPVVELGAKAVVGLGRFDVVDPALPSISAELARPLLAAAAYEKNDLDALTKMAAALPAGVDANGGLSTRIARLRGKARIGDPELDKLMKTDPLGDLCAVDAWLDAGALDRVEAVVATWPQASENPLYALRVARLRRYQGKLSAASNALDAAPTSHGAQVERVLIELASDDPSESVFSLIDDRVGDDRVFLQAYALARTKDADKAQRILDAREPPPVDAPFEERVVAALAYSAVKDDSKGAPMARLLLESFPQNPDVIRIGKAFGLESRSN